MGQQHAIRISVSESATEDPAARAIELAGLRDHLAGELELRGRVSGVEQPPVPGSLGPILDVLLVALEPEGTVAVLAAGLVSWLQRRSDVTIRVERPDGRVVELQASRVKVNGEAVKDLIRALEQDTPESRDDTPRDASAGPDEPGETGRP